MAAKLYLESSLRKYPYVTIDCQVINERSLDEMTREIVKVVLSQCGGNQTLAAKKPVSYTHLRAHETSE